MRRIFVLAAFLLHGLLPLGALENAEVQDILFLPPDFYVGDRVEVRVVFSPDPGMRVLPPEETPVISWLEIHDLKLEQNGEDWEIRIDFTPFAAGTRSFPAMSLGDVVFSDVKLHTKSILQEEEIEFSGIKGQLYLPGTRLGIGLVVALLLAGPLMIFTFTGRVRRFVKRFVSFHAGRRPHKRLVRVLKELDDQHLHMSSRKFYIILSEEFRRYLTDRTGRDFLTVTSSEARQLLTLIFPQGSEHNVDALEKMIRQSDLIKFGGLNANRKQRVEDLDLVKNAAKELEAHIEEEYRAAETRQRNRKKHRRLQKVK